MYYIIKPTSEDLQHHGVLGMKWGVRRYQNYNGSYTRAGMEHYKKSLKKYEDSKERKIIAKNNYKRNRTDSNKNELKKAKTDLKQSKKNLNRDYDQLKKDKMADKGKNVYNSGRTITGNTIKVSGLTTGSVLVGSGTRYLQQSGILSTKTSAVGYAASIGMGAVAAMLKLRNESDARKLRAYYSHSRPKV